MIIIKGGLLYFTFLVKIKPFNHVNKQMVEFAAFDIRNQMQLPFIKINPVIIVFSASQMQHYSLCHLTLSVFPSSPQRYMLPSEHKGQTYGCDAESPPYR
jgi:hypothetical protein